jgi:CHAT domain-containing protein/Tfp pilus assembly protein PilF
MPANLLTIYREGQQLIQDAKAPAGAARWREGAAEAEKLQSNITAAWLLFQSASVQVSGSQSAEADASYQQAIHLSAEAGPQTESWLLREWANSLLKRGNLENAEKYAREALTRSQDANELGTASSLKIIGSVSFYRWQLDEAEANYKSALTIIDAIAPESMDAGIILGYLGNVAFRRGELKKAEDLFRQGLAIVKNFPPEGVEMTSALNGLSVVSAQRGDLALAESSMQKVIAILQRFAPNGADFATSISNLGLFYLQRGDLAQADHYLRQGLALREKAAPGSFAVAQSLTNLGETALERGDWTEAEKDDEQALAIRQKLAPVSPSLAGDLNNLGLVALKRGDFARAKDYLQRALAIQEKFMPESLEHSASLQNLGDLAQREGDLDKAEDYYRRSLAIREKVAPDTTVHAENLAALASVIKKKGDLSAAQQLFEKGLNVLEAQIARVGGTAETRSGYRARHLKSYQDYVDLLMLNHQPELAFHVVERSRAQSLLEMLSEAHADVHAGVDPDLLRQERSLRDHIAALSNWKIKMLVDKRPGTNLEPIREELDELVTQYRELEGQIRTSSPAYAALTHPQPVTVAEVQHQLLDQDTLLLEYSLGEERSYVWTISQTQVASHELAKRSEIEDAAQRLYRLLTARNQELAGETRPQREARLAQSEKAYGSVAAELSRLVLGPLTGELQHKRLLVVSDGALQYIPFALLPEARSADGSPAGTPLVAEHEIVNLPSASVFAVLRNDAPQSKHPKMLAVLADPVFSKDDARVRARAGRVQKTQRVAAASPSGDVLTRAAADLAFPLEGGSYLPRLPFTQREARAIVTTVPAGQAMVMLGFDANREHATSRELANYRVVHFATHGLLDNSHPELSGLVFSLLDRNGKAQNGFVEMQDIYNLNLPVDLVVLSACETGLGMNIRGEGLVGLTRGFMYAGASRVLASLWSVDDVATSELMRKFYDAMFREHMPPSAALRKAKLEMLQEERWRSPYYWAAFVLQGEWKQIAE